MRRAGGLAAIALAGLFAGPPWQVSGQPSAGVQWIWFNEGDPTKAAPAATRYFRKTFNQPRPFVDEADLDITADDAFTVWINGVEVGKGDTWKRVYHFDIKKHIVQGKNVVAVKAVNHGSAAGLLAGLAYVPNGQSKELLVTDASWKTSKEAAEGWQQPGFEDRSWAAAKVLGPYGSTGPWKNLTWDSRGNERFRVPPGFRVEMVVPPDIKADWIPAKRRFSVVNMTFDAKGRLLLSQEGGPIVLCTDPDKKGVFQSVKPYCTQVKNCQGMCWVKDALLLVGDGPQRTGLYRVRDSRGTDQTDEVTLLQKFRGGMGEHGPHAILHGPDDWLYVVIGNHAAATPEKLAANSPLLRWPTGGPGPDQGNLDTTEDVLLARLNDARGHAANILAPGGTIWRMDHEGKNLSLVSAGYRNHFDAAFSPTGELFTFDSDMEWDEGLPWYRPVRVCHAPPGSDFVWRTGAANTPDYYVDSLPSAVDTGRGSPVGLEFYDHHVFPDKYRGCCFMADWSLGIIYAMHFKREGASYKATAERFCEGAPMNVTDLAVGPDGALYFSMGGRNTEGGVYRIVSTEKLEPKGADCVQPLAAWARAKRQKDVSTWIREAGKEKTIAQLFRQFLPPKDGAIAAQSWNSHYLLAMMQMHGLAPGLPLLEQLVKNEEPELRARGVWLIGVNGYKEGRATLVTALMDADKLVRRHACEALIRAGIEPPVEAIWPLLGDRDRFLRTAARLVLQRIDPKKWTDRLWKEANDETALDGIIALCKTNQSAPLAEPIFARLRTAPKEPQTLLDYLRTVQIALVHTGERPASVQAVASQCDQLFPHSDWRINRELAILLTYFRKEKILTTPVHAKLLAALLASKDDRPQQIHYFYCFRFLTDGWTANEHRDLAAWYNGTQTWSGGHSFTPFLENIFREALGSYHVADRKQLLLHGDKMPLPALVLAKRLQADRQPELLSTLSDLSTRLTRADAKTHRLTEVRQAVADAITKTALAHPSTESWPYLVLGLQSSNPVVLFDVIAALKKTSTKPKADDPAPFRSLLLASGKLNEKNRWQVVELLRHWTNDRRFGEEEGQWKPALQTWTKWFAQTFPKEPALPDLVADKPPESKYKFDELLAFLDKDPVGRQGDPARGRLVFEKASCIKCHKYGKDGEGVGPDLTTLSKRFKRLDILESIIYPSKVISDQYRSVTILTTRGQTLHDLAAVQADAVTVLQSDGSKVTLSKKDIEQQFASLVSVMPERLLDPLTRQEIADLFAYMESEPQK